MRFFDAHNHLQEYAAPAELAAALAAAAAAGVEGMLCCGTRPADWQRVLEISSADKRIISCLGLHPWFAAEAGAGWLEKLEELLRAPACIGEIGLDAVRDASGQEEVFIAQLELAKKLNRPVILHCVRAWGRLAELLRAHRPPAFMLHAYSGSPELVITFTALGGYFSFDKGLLVPERAKLRAALKTVPRARLLFETEAPVPGGNCAGPAGITEVVKAAAQLLAVPAGELAELSFRNGCEFTGGVRTWPL